MDWTALVPGSRLLGGPAAPTGATHDSRLVMPGFAFIAVHGSRADGHDYLGTAIAAGASLAVVQQDAEAKWGPYEGKIPLLVVLDSRRSMGTVAAAIYGHPSRALRTIGVTGTDGKTTTTHLAAHILDRAGLACGYLSSVGFDLGAGFLPNLEHMTTLESTVVQAMLADALAAGKRSMVLEASSEGLAQHRLEGCEVDAAVFRNLSRDHLDFHGSIEAYRDAKGILFQMLRRESGKSFPRAAVLNADDPVSDYYRSLVKTPVVTYGVESPADFRAELVSTEKLLLTFVLVHRGRRHPVTTKLMGVHNCLAALAVADSQGVPFEEAIAAAESFPGVPGRLEAIECGQPFRVIVDIASTPASLEYVLNTLRPATAGNLWVVFGAAGGRDPARRDGMGRVAGQLADRAVLTNEDPRDEDPEAIIEAIASGLRQAGRVEGQDFVRIPDRAEAIRHALASASAGDTVLLAGKATEPTMIFADGARPWDERAVAREAFSPVLTIGRGSDRRPRPAPKP
jgi:UDP-N-acetylmuramoyl-L-alanyl-D-glutamate--2,6-diaminopimelate ligase